MLDAASTGVSSAAGSLALVSARMEWFVAGRLVRRRERESNAVASHAKPHPINEIQESICPVLEIGICHARHSFVGTESETPAVISIERLASTVFQNPERLISKRSLEAPSRTVVRLRDG